MKSCGTYYDFAKDKCDSLLVWGSSGFYSTMRWHKVNYKIHLFFEKYHWIRLTKTAELLAVQSLDLGFLKDAVLHQINEFLEKYSECPGGLIRISILPDGYHILAYESLVPKKAISGKLLKKQRKKPELKLLWDLEIYEELLKMDRIKEELLLVSEDGDILEGATSNIIIRSHFGTHLLKRGVLNGVTQSMLFPAISNFCSKIIHTPLNVKQIQHVTEIICVGSGKEVTPIHSIPELNWQNNGESSLFHFLKESHRVLKENEIL